MKKNRIVVSAIVIAAFAIAATNGFAQYGACGPTCDVPTCDVPTCEPTCAEPTCDVPMEPTCGASIGCGYDVGCTASCGYEGSCYGSCGGCFSLCSVIDGAVRVATAPFQWLICEFNDGIFPDCGCAPPPAKTPCNPCTICGDYVGGCNDHCDALPYGGCNSCVSGGYVDQSAINYSGDYSIGTYDSEAYDSSPTRMGAYNSGNTLGSLQQPKKQNPQANQNMIAARQANQRVKSVNYEQRSQARPAVNKANQVQNVRQTTVRRPADQNLQNKQNVRIVNENVDMNQKSGPKTFGTLRPIQ